MKRAISIALSALLLATAGPPALSQTGGEQGQVREQRKAGNVRSLRQIEQLILPRMKGMKYLGPEYDPVAMAYRLKFIRDGRVEFVDVDARSARILNHSR